STEYRGKIAICKEYFVRKQRLNPRLILVQKSAVNRNPIQPSFLAKSSIAASGTLTSAVALNFKTSLIFRTISMPVWKLFQANRFELYRRSYVIETKGSKASLLPGHGKQAANRGSMKPPWILSKS